MRTLNKKKVAVLALCVCSALYNVAHAEKRETGDLPEYDLNAMVVTATRTPLEEKKISQSVEVITRREIENIGAVNVIEALRLANNLEINNDSHVGNSISLRGGQTQDVLVLLNGRRIPGEGSGGMVMGNVYVLQRLNVANIERIEILRGPAGALYGSEAKAGVINIITRKSKHPSASVGFSTTSRQIGNYYHFDTGRQDKFSAVLDANFTKTRYLRYPGSAAMSKYYGPRQNYSLDMDYEFDDRHGLNLYLDYENTDQEAEYFNSITGASNYTSPYKVDRKTASLSYKGRDGKNEYMVGGSYGQLKKRSGSGGGTSVSRSKFQFWNFEARDTVTINEKNRLTFGGEYKKEGRQDSNMNEIDSQWSVYVHDEIQVSDKLFVLPSFRYDHHESFGGQTSPHLGMTWQFNDRQRLKADYGKGYRAPSVTELYGTMMGGTLTIGNPNLRPEKSTGYEISYEQEWKNTEGRLAYFKNKKSNAISLVGTSLFDMKYRNVNKTRSRGVEFAVKQRLGNGFALKGNYNWLDSIDESTGSRLNYSPRNAYTLRLSWEDPAQTGWGAELWNKWYTDFRIGGNNYSLNTFNLVVTKRWENKYRAYAGLDNVFDKKHEDLGYSGRIWRAGAEMSF